MMTISKERLQAMTAIRDEDLDYSDIPETDESFWSQAAARRADARSAIRHDAGAEMAEPLSRSALRGL